MSRLSPVVRILRWLAFVPTVYAVALAGPILSSLLELGADPWLDLPVFFFGTAAAVYLGSRVAPSRGRLSVVLAVGLLLLPLLYLVLAEPDSIIFFPLRTVIAGITLGGVMAWRQVRSGPPQVVRSTQDRSLRYKGTAPFQHSVVDRTTFFGRDREIRSLLNLVLAERLIVLFGKSGMGKSSLINAGLIEPMVERGYFPMTVRLTDREHGPVKALLDGVRSAAQTSGVEIAGGDESDLWTFFKTAEFWSSSNDLLHPVLILDQFEELFTLHAPEPRREFIVQLAEVLRGRGATRQLARPASASVPSPDSGPSKLKIVLSLREDYLADLEELARDIPGVLQHRFRLGALNAENAREAIVKPAALDYPAFDTAPFTYREDALKRILSFLATRRQGDETVKGDDVEPVQLQLICQYVEDLVHTRLSKGSAGMRIEVSEADLGGQNQLQRVLEDFYDRTLASIGSPRERRRIRRLCERRLISGGGRRLTEAEEEIEKKHGVSKERLRELVNTRLLRPEPRLGGVFYELSHDTLVEPIRRSRKKRVFRRRSVLVGTVIILTAYFGSWWMFSGRQNRARQQALAFAAIGLPDRNDPGEFLELAKVRLRTIQEQFPDAVGSREGYGAMMFAAEEIGLRYPELNDEVWSLQNAITQEFNSRLGLKPPDPEDDRLRNPRVLITGGSFQMGSREAADSERPAHRVTVSPFEIQEHEVTNAEYRRFDPNHQGLFGDDKPVADVSWLEAMAYAAWLGGSLPTEAQWEFAARGKEGRKYPWGGEDPTCERANSLNSVCGYIPEAVKTGRELGKTPEGVYDLAGNVSEWCRDWFGTYRSEDQIDPLGPATGSNRVVRGGVPSYSEPPHSDIRGATRNSQSPEIRWYYNGFRVVWSAARKR